MVIVVFAYPGVTHPQIYPDWAHCDIFVLRIQEATQLLIKISPDWRPRSRWMVAPACRSIIIFSHTKTATSSTGRDWKRSQSAMKLKLRRLFSTVTYSFQQMTYSSKYFREGRMVWPAILSHIICTSWHHISGHSALGILLICEWPHESLKAWRPIGSPVVNVPVSRMQTYYFTCCGLRCTYSIQ